MTNETTPASDDPQVVSGKWFERALLLAIVLASAVAISPNPADPDLWGHVQYGRDLLADGKVPATTTYSFTAEGYRWINHENLSEVLFAVGADTFGPIGLLIVKCLLGLGLAVLILRHGFLQGVGLIAVSATVLLVSVNMAFHWSVRPQLLSFVHFALLIALLSYCFRGWEGKWRLPQFGKHADPADVTELNYSSMRMRFLWLAPLLFISWTNSHGGFVAGLCIYTAYLGCRSIEVLACRGWAGIGLVKRFTMMIAAAVLASFINPYGLGLHRWLIQSLGTPRPEIAEWWSPNLFTLSTMPLWLIVITFASALLLTRRSRDFTHLTLMGIVLWQALTHQRHIPFFAIMFGFWMPIHIQSLLGRWNIAQEGSSFGAGMSRQVRWSLVGGLCVAYAVLGFKLYDRIHDMPVDREHYPVAAMQYMADQDLNGRLIVTYNWAQYAIAAFGVNENEEKRMRVSFDGRFRTCYPQEIVDMHFDFLLGNSGGPGQRYRSPHSPPLDGNRVLEFGQPDLVLISRGQEVSVDVMNANLERWVLLYQDGLAQVWGRKSKYDDPNSPNFISQNQRQISDAPQTGVVTWPALPVRGRKSGRLVKQSDQPKTES